MNNRVVIVGNGTLSKKYLRLMKPTDYVIGVDRAAYWLIRQGRIPDAAIGDFDSVTEKELSQIKEAVPSIQQYSKDKNQTDMELAVRHAIKKKPSAVLILGGTGSRLDHTVATWQLLERLLSAQIPHHLINETNRISMIGQGRTILVSGRKYRYVSILPYTQTVIFALSGFRYNLSKTTLIRGATRGISNEITGRQAQVTIFSGKAWVVESND